MHTLQTKHRNLTILKKHTVDKNQTNLTNCTMHTNTTNHTMHTNLTNHTMHTDHTPPANVDSSCPTLAAVAFTSN